MAWCGLVFLVGCTGVVGASPTRRPGDDDADADEDEESGEDEGDDGGGEGGHDAVIAPAPVRMARLTRAEYENTIRDLFGAAVLGQAAAVIGRDHATLGSLAIGAREVAVPRADVRGYAEAAEGIAERAVASSTWKQRWVSCTPANGTDATCARTVVERLGLRLFRRPLSEDETLRWADVVTSVGASSDFWKGLGAALTGLLMSPHFTHRIEIGQKRDDRVAFTSYEMASRLSYLLWDTTPDEALLAAAEKDELTSLEGLERAADRLLGDRERLSTGVRALFDDVLGLQKVLSVPKDPTRFPFDAPELRASMRESTLRMVVAVLLDEKRPLLDLYDAGVAFSDARLASIYGQAGGTDALARLDLPTTGKRIGVLTEPSLLAAHAGPLLTSPTFRGKFVREHLLCETVPAPPPNVNNNLPVNAEGRTRREQLENHRDNPACRDCHAAIDPIGFGLEHFDAIGRVQTTDNGVPVDASGDLDGVAFEDARGLSQAVRAHAGAEACLRGRILEHVLGREADEADRAALAAAADASGLVPALRLMVIADAFRFATP